MDTTSGFHVSDLGGLSGTALGVTWGMLVGLTLLVVATAWVARRIIAQGPGIGGPGEPLAEASQA